MTIRPKDRDAFIDALDEIYNWATQKELYSFLSNVIAEQVPKDDLLKFMDMVQKCYK